MALINLKCPNCNGEIQMDDTKETGFCLYCGNKFMVKDELVKIAIEHSGSVQVDRVKEVENLVIRANQKIDEIIAENNNKVDNAGKNGDIKIHAHLSTIKQLNAINVDYVEKALDLDAKNDNTLKLKSRITELICQYTEKHKELCVDSNEKTKLGCLLVFLGMLIFIIIVYVAFK